MHDSEHDECFGRAFTRFLKNDSDVLIENLICELDREYQSWRSKPLIEFGLWANVSIKITLDDTRTLFGSQFVLSRDPPKIHENREEPYFTCGSSISTYGRFKTPSVAGYILSERIENAVAFWNLWSGIEQAWPRHGLAKYKLEKNLYLFDRDKKFIDQQDWINTEFVGFTISNPLANAYDLSDSDSSEISMGKDNPIISEIIKCTRIINESDLVDNLKIRSMLIWNCIEILFGKNTGESSDKYMARATFFYYNESLIYAMMSTLRDVRNGAVHGAVSGATLLNSVSLVDALSLHVKFILRWCYFHGAKFKSRSEFLRFLELPRESSKLSELKLLVSFAEEVASSADRRS